MHDRHAVERVLKLHAEGWNASQIARATGIARSTVRDWIGGALPQSIHMAPCERGSACLRDGPRFPMSYSYMLGMYLGDGCISEGAKGVYAMRISLDLRYPEIVFECTSRLQVLCPENQVSVYPMSGGAKGVVVKGFSKHWPCLFPQHGSGMKHRRPIELESWQQTIVRAEPEMFLRGLIHSDGCRNINNRGRGSRWTGVRYTFSNRSDDIRRMFCDACDQLDIHWTNMNVYTISVARRGDTERLDAFIGPKQ